MGVDDDHPWDEGCKQVAWIDPRTGKVLETVPFEGKTLLSDDAAHPIIADRDERRDAAGQVVEGARVALLDVSRSRFPGTGSGPPNRAVVRELESGAPLMHIAHDAWSIGEWPGAGEQAARRYAAIYVHRADEPGEVRVVRFDPF
ncbi:MAG TPA: hypothetical protein ENK57_06220 [Polyangiaceae bacterium]|nr:hypothetical protein [Polyangiaceae bacterium]